MRFVPRHAGRMRPLVLAAAALTAVLATTVVASAALVAQVSTDPYTTSNSQHATEVEPGAFSYGSTTVMAFQVGRFYDGGATNIGFATSTDGGASWTHGFLPGITVAGGGHHDRVSDPAVAYDAKHKVWLISSLPLDQSPSLKGVAVIVSRSLDGGLTWSNPVVVSTGGDLDKDWITCDNTPTSPFYGNCYTEFDNYQAFDMVKMSVSSDGGLSWRGAQTTANRAKGLGGVPVVQPNGNVVVPLSDSRENSILVFGSTDGGRSWTATRTIARVNDHTVAGGLRTGPLPSAGIDASGKIYVVWQDCRFESGCTANDIVMSTSIDGKNWTQPVRIPIDPVGSGVDHFLPGLGVDGATSGNSAHLGLTYYYYPRAKCNVSTCQLMVGFVSSIDGGHTWSATTRLAGPMAMSWLPRTSEGPMVGDYMATSFSNGQAIPAFIVASAPKGSRYDQAAYSVVGGITPTGGHLVAEPSDVIGLASATSDHALAAADLARR